MPTYAKNTEVAPERSRAEIERTLERYNAGGFGYYVEQNRAAIVFQMQNRRMRILISFPPLSDFEMTPAGYVRTSQKAIQEAHDQAVRQRWRALALYVKAKCEAVEAGIVTFEDAWLAHVVLPDGRTVGEIVTPQIDEAYRTGHLPPLLPAPERE